jgi:hypothetical protein
MAKKMKKNGSGGRGLDVQFLLAKKPRRKVEKGYSATPMKATVFDAA